MITQNELYDLSYALMLIRSEIANPFNTAMLDAVLPLLRDTGGLIGDNQIRKTLRQIQGLDERWEFTKHDNYYVHNAIFKEAAVQNELWERLNELKSLLQAKKFEQADDLADVVHALPQIIADNDGRIPADHQKIFLKAYRKRWGAR